MSTLTLPTRWLFTATLHTHSALRIGGGDDALDVEEFDMPIRNVTETEATIAKVNPVMVGHNNRPFIPGSSLRGALRALLAQANAAQSLELFGFMDHTGGQAGRLRIFDAPLQTAASGSATPGQHPERATQVLARTAIDPVRRAARLEKLIHQEAVPSGSTFDLRIELEGSADQATCLWTLLHALGNSPAGQGLSLGQGRSIGRGDISVRGLNCKQFDTHALQSWLDQALQSSVTTPDLWKPELTCTLSPDPQLLTLLQQRWCPLHLTLEFHTPLLVSDPAKAKARGHKTDDPSANQHPTLDPKGHALLPGSSVKGVLRSQAQRIERTLGWPQAADSPCLRLFGQTTAAGWLRVSNFVGSSPAKDEDFEFVAIDRFTGGAADGAKFKFKALIKPTVQGHIALDTEALQRDIRHAPQSSLQTLGLLALLLRDLFEGDLRFGGHHASGFGCCTAKAGPTQALQAALRPLIAQALHSCRPDIAIDPDDWRALAQCCVDQLRRAAAAPTALETTHE